eukprot:81306_1
MENLTTWIFRESRIREHTYYEDGNCGLHVPWTFLVVMKSDDSQNMWYRTEAQLAVNIHDRIVPTHDGLSPMKYFDSAQMQAYIYPHHIYEIEFCRQQPLPESCQILVEELEYTPNVQLSALEVRKSGAGKHSGRGLYTTVDIKKGSSIGRRESARSILIHPSTIEVLERMAKYSNRSG